MTRKEIEREKKDFIGCILIGVIMHIATVIAVVVQFFPEVTTGAIAKAIIFGLLMVGTLVAYWINMVKYAKAIKKAEKNLEE
jgi:predicted ABC-type sugar transport system permease subunit